MKSIIFILRDEDIDLADNQIVMIGDQIMTDVFGANRKGIKSILVKPIVTHDIIYTWLNRAMERLVFKWIGINPAENWGDQID